LKADVFLIDAVRCSCFEFSPQMSIAVEIRQNKSLSFVTDRQWNIRKALLAGRRSGCRTRSKLAFPTL
jgi:hypothetical protein